MNNYKQLNIIFGWGTFFIAALTYLLTIEPTTSFWDCGEFIATAHKLQVGHPPGAPLYMIVARLFSLLSFGNESNVALMINALSALVSAFTILFLFWTITHLAKKMLCNSKTPNLAQGIGILGSGLVGAFAYTFSDTFWFSAVEAEVYAFSSLFTAVVFWAILKWENVADEKHSHRWLILIAYLMGLSIGVHLLNLLAIPAIVLVYYFRKHKTTPNGIMVASGVALALLGGIMYVIIPGLVKFASWFELIFVNSFGMPFNSGAIVYSILVICLIIFGLYYTYKHKKVIANTLILGITVIIIGYSSFTMIVIRSFANPMIDENNPENVFALLSYLNREQYGDRPLFKGQYYNAPITGQTPSFSYIQHGDKYEKVKTVNPDYEYDSRFTTLFPRMYSHQRNHVRGYETWGSISGTPIEVENRYGENETLVKPSFFDNIEFFLRYQIGHMYFRYFMWNFAGRQNDVQGHGNVSEGNWISGFNFLDSMRLGPQKNLPEEMANNKARNKYYLLPLILGLIGFIFSLQKDVKTFWIVTLLFFFTGIAIVIYLNQTPYQPRERDYAYAGSFYAFAIWIGFGVLGIYNYLKEYINQKTSALVSTLVCLLIPVLMLAQNYDDHDRSGRYTARDLAANYLNSCEKNAILFTYGDNDTFPLWYAQDVEGVRTDVRVVNLSLLGTDWYISQMKRRAYTSDPVPFSMVEKEYIQGKLDIAPVLKRIDKRIHVKEVVKFLASDDQRTKIGYGTDEEMDYLPTNKLFFEVDSAKVVENGTIPKDKIDQMVSKIEWDLSKNYLTKSEIMILDLLASFNWDRPIYFASSIGKDNFLGLEKHFQLEGFAYRLVPYKTEPDANIVGDINTDIAYDNLINKFNWGRLNAEDVYLDEQNKRTLKIMDVRELFTRLANKLIEEGKTEKAKKVIDLCFEVLPHRVLVFNYFSKDNLEVYYKLGEFEIGDKHFEQMVETSYNDLQYYLQLDITFQKSYDYERNLAMYALQDAARITKKYNRMELYEKVDSYIKTLSESFGVPIQ